MPPVNLEKAKVFEAPKVKLETPYIKEKNFLFKQEVEKAPKEYFKEMNQPDINVHLAQYKEMEAPEVKLKA